MILVDHPLSPDAQKVRLVLSEKQIDFESREIWRQDQRDELCIRERLRALGCKSFARKVGPGDDVRPISCMRGGQ